LTSLIALTTAP